MKIYPDLLICINFFFKKNGIHFCRNRKFGYGGVLFSRDKYDLQGIENGYVTSNQAESGNQINKEIEKKNANIN